MIKKESHTPFQSSTPNRPHECAGRRLSLDAPFLELGGDRVCHDLFPWREYGYPLLVGGGSALPMQSPRSLSFPYILVHLPKSW